jgi:putative hemolysin
MKGFAPLLPKSVRNAFLRLLFCGVKTPLGFQKRFMWPIVNHIIRKYTDGCTFDDSSLRVNSEQNSSIFTLNSSLRYTFVSNHPLGGIDGVTLGSILGRQYDDGFRYLVNDLLMNLPGLAPLCIPINKTGSQSRNFPAMVEAGFQSDNHMLMFPAGLCSRKKDGVISDIPWTKTFISKSVQYQRDVVPIHFGGQNSNFFYRLANFSDRFLPFNLAMLFLVDEMYKNVHKTFRVAIGKPIPWQTFDKSRTPKEWAQYVRSEVYKL